MESIITVDASYLFDDEDESASQLPATTSVPTLSTLTPIPRVAGAASKNKENAQEHGELDADLRNRAKSKALRNRYRVRKSSPLAHVDNMDVDEPLTPTLANITNTTSLNDAVTPVKTAGEQSCSGPARTSRSYTSRTSPNLTDARPTLMIDLSNSTTSMDDVLSPAIEPALHENVVDDVADSQPLDSTVTTASPEYPVEGLIEFNIPSTNSQPDDSDHIPHVDFLDEKIFGRMDDLPPRCSTPEPDHDLPFDPSLRLDIEHVPERRPTQKNYTDKQFHKLPLRLQLAEHIVEQKLWEEYERALEEHKRVKRLELAFRLQQEMQMLEEEEDDEPYEDLDGDAEEEEEEEDISALLHEAMEDFHGATVDASLGVPELSAESLASTSTSMTLDTVVAQILNARTLTATSIPPASTIDIADLFSSQVNNAGAAGATAVTVTSVPDGMDPTSLPAPATGSHDDTEYNAEADTTFDSVTYSTNEDGDIYADSDDEVEDDDEQTLYSDTDSDSESTLMILPVRPSSSRRTTIPKERLLWDAYARVLLSAHRLCRRKGNWDCEDRHYEYRDVPDPEFNRYNVVIEDAKNAAWSLRAYGGPGAVN